MKTKDEKRWEEFFRGGFYLQTYNFMIDHNRTEKEIEGVLNLLNPTPRAHILDWCGGWGRHSLELVKRGFKVTLLDFAPKHLQLAKERAKKVGLELNTVLSDFRETPEGIQADFAVNLFTSGIGYLTEEDDIKALKSLNRALKPNAKFLLDTVNIFWIARNYQPLGITLSQDEKIHAIEKRSFDFWSNRNQSKRIYTESLKKGCMRIIRNLDLRIYSPAELIAILRKSSFEPLSLYGDFDGQPFTFDSRRIIVISQKA